jgi:aspartyl-tRNA(Asn)/glutamyl-tRNA(Gln) amidotransferase subunit A
VNRTNEPVELDLATASARLEDRALSSVDLTRACLARIAALDRTLHAFITVSGERALDAAAEADRRASRGERFGPLDGVPIAVKDNIDVAGVPTTNGMASRRDRVVGRDAEVVRRLRAAGAVIVGKLNMHEAALGGTGDNPHFGRTENPHRPGHTPGGSSSGSGAAVAARLCFAALGTDTLGSVRLPAAYCGVAGIKPTFGLVSTSGVVPLSKTLDHVGVLTRSARDLELVLDVITGSPGESNADHDSRASTSAPAERTAIAAENVAMDRIVLGRPRDFDHIGIATEIVNACQRAIALLVTLGCRVRDVDVLTENPERVRRAALLVIEAEGAMAHADEVEARAFSADIQAMLEYGRNVSAELLGGACRTLAEARLDVLRALGDVDLLVLPTACESAFPFAEPAPAGQALLTSLGSVAGVPAASVPMGMSSDGLPIGLQIVGRPFAERIVLGTARAYESAAGWDMRPSARPSPVRW